MDSGLAPPEQEGQRKNATYVNLVQRRNFLLQVESEAKKKRTKVRKVVRSVVGLSASELQKKRAVPRDVRRKEREAAVK